MKEHILFDTLKHDSDFLNLLWITFARAALFPPLQKVYNGACEEKWQVILRHYHNRDEHIFGVYFYTG